MSSEIEEIKSRLNIVEVISSYIKLEKAGANFRACCPFHSEKSPSFFVSPSRQIWHCFGCGEGGDIFQFVMKIEGVEFLDALKILAQKAGVQLEHKTESYKKLKSERQVIYEICNLSSLFFQTQLRKSKKGEGVLKYLYDRKITDDSITDFKIGYAPDLWNSLSDFLVSRGHKREDVEKAGLAVKREGKDSIDRFRSRIMFPIFDINSQIVGFTGRIFNKKDEVAKYLNTPNTLVYDKSRIIYGLDKAKIDIRREDRCVLVEGNVDCMMSHQAGIKNAVAVSGTALTNTHLNILKRYSNNLSLAFDMDMAGNKATKRSVDLAQKTGFNIKVVEMPRGKDPADVISEGGKESWEKLIKDSKPIMQFYFDIALEGKDLALVEDKKEVLNILLPEIKIIENKIEQAHWIEELSSSLKAREEDIREELGKVESGLEHKQMEEDKKDEYFETKNRKDLLQEQILSLILINPSRIKEIRIDDFGGRYKRVLEKIKNDPSISSDDLVKSFDAGAKDFLGCIFLKSDLIRDMEIDIEKELKLCLSQLERLEIKAKLDEISLDLKNAERENNSEEVKKLTEEFNLLTKKLI